MDAIPLTPAESVASLRRQYARLRWDGADHRNAVEMLANRHGLTNEQVEHFCPIRSERPLALVAA